MPILRRKEMIAAFDTYYYNGYSYTVAGVFKSWGDKDVAYYATSKRMCIDAEYKPGELYKRELPCIMQCLALLPLKDITLIMVDDFVWLSEDGKTLTKGLGAHLQDAIFEKYGERIAVVGVAKNKYHVDIPTCFEIKRGLESKKPLFVTCSEPSLSGYYSTYIKCMYGDYRIPNILKAVDSKTREFGHTDIKEIEKELESEYNKKGLDFDLTELDDWAEKELSIKRSSDEIKKIEDLEEWIADTEKNGFRYR